MAFFNLLILIGVPALGFAMGEWIGLIIGIVIAANIEIK